MASLTAALALHVAEEAGGRDGFPAWARRNAWPGYPPLWWRETRDALRSGRLSRRGAAVAAMAGGVIHLAAVRKQVYGSTRTVAPWRSRR